MHLIQLPRTQIPYFEKVPKIIQTVDGNSIQIRDQDLILKRMEYMKAKTGH